MKLLFLLLLALLLGSNASFSQAPSITLTGTVQDLLYENSLGYVNIGWVDRQLGTVSNEQGHFRLEVPANLPDSAVLRFSMIGYATQDFFWKDIKPNTTMLVELAAVITKIQEITVTDCSLDTRKHKGNVLKKTPIGWMSFVSKELGTEIATRIQLRKKRESHLKTLHLWIGSHEHDTLFFRLNIYAVEDGRPGDNLLTENIFITIPASGERVAIDLEPYRLSYEQDIFVALEYVRALESDKEEGVTFGSNLFGKSSYVRFSSQSSWYKTPILNLGFSVEVCEQK